MIWPEVICTRSYLRILPLSLLALGLVSVIQSSVAQAQTSSSKAAPAESSSGLGFSIETEMLTYRALESNSEAIACDVAGYLHSADVSFKNLAPGSVCNVNGTGSGTNAGVVVLPFDRNVFADFQIWRSDLQTMAEFEQRGATACSAKQPGTNAGFSSRGLGSTASTAAGAVASVGGVMAALTPAGAMLTTGSGLLGLFASDHASSPTTGTIQDQAFMDDVSRELRAVDVSVLMPSVYTPYALTSIDPTRSPFLIALDKLLHTRDCLVADKTKNDADVKNIDAFLAGLAAPTKPASAAPPADASAAPAVATSQPTATDTSSKAGSITPSHLQSVLSADGLAVRLGADPQTGQIPANAPHHVLLLKALESGGSISRSSNLFGSKLSYSGGSVGTYAMFGLNGDLECSGNVYDYAGFVSAKNFQKQLHAYKPDPSKELVFIRGGCRAR
jgi:hypothetical protein